VSRGGDQQRIADPHREIALRGDDQPPITEPGAALDERPAQHRLIHAAIVSMPAGGVSGGQRDLGRRRWVGGKGELDAAGVAAQRLGILHGERAVAEGAVDRDHRFEFLVAGRVAAATIHRPDDS
jgi:hypothetical protein